MWLFLCLHNKSVASVPGLTLHVVIVRVFMCGRKTLKTEANKICITDDVLCVRQRRATDLAHAYTPACVYSIAAICGTSQEMAVAVRVLLAALVGLYWSSSRVEGNITANYKIKSSYLGGTVHVL